MSETDAKPTKPPTLGQDLAVLTKVRLNIFVLVTTLFGFVLSANTQNVEWSGQLLLLLLHCLLGTACAAFGSAAFNQLMEIEEDLRMKRTADRPLPSRRMVPTSAFAIGWVLAAFGIIHLSAKVSAVAASLAAVTIAIYVFIYTPLKRKSSVNTLVGAIPGAIPPMIGWVSAGGGFWDAGSWILFGLLFFWQMPHFVAINWLCREEYEDAGYQMWANGDVSGKKTAVIAAGFSIVLAICGLLPACFGLAAWWACGVAAVAGLLTAWLSWKFYAAGDRAAARKLFFSTLIYLPVVLGVLAIGWI